MSRAISESERTSFSPVMSSVISFFGGLYELRHIQGATSGFPNALEGLVIGSTRGRVDEATGDTADKNVVGDEELNGVLDALFLRVEHLVELFGLRHRSGEAVEDEAAQHSLRLNVRQSAKHAHPFWHSLLVSSSFLIMLTMISSETRPPASMICFASLPNGVPFET